MEFLRIGIDSPVSIDSLIIQAPFSRIQSQGTVHPSRTSIKSPGTISLEFFNYLFFDISVLIIISFLFSRVIGF